MDTSLEDSGDEHKRVIIHLDIDCYYAQVEEIRDPELRSLPLGINQKDFLVTSNYVARSFGIKKMMLLSEAKRLCPSLCVVNGEDLTPYRQMSNKIFQILLRYTPKVEKLGLDENFMDVTDVIANKLSNDVAELSIKGHVYPDGESLGSCCCGCEKRLMLGTMLASEIRQALFTELGITCCAGIAHNKLLAKIAGSRHKPNMQTVLVPDCASDMMIAIDTIRGITGIGEKAEQQLNEIGICTVEDLQNVNLSILANKFGNEKAYKYKNWSRGIDNTPVIPSGKPKTISLEDSCKSISYRADAEEKFRLLLIRLVSQVAEDGRIPLVVKITIRKFDSLKKTSYKESKQANIAPLLFKEMGNGRIMLIEGGLERLLSIVMRLFERVIDLKLPFNITLLGLAFSKFKERQRGAQSIANYLIKNDLEVQSIINLKSDGCTTSSISHNIFEKMRNHLPGSPIQMDFDAMSETSHASCSSDVSEPEIEPSPKKTRMGFMHPKRRCLASDDKYDTASPSKLRVADLRLNSREHEVDLGTTPMITQTIGSSCSTMLGAEKMSISSPPQPMHERNSCTRTNSVENVLPPQCPSTVDPEVFKALPIDVQEELLNQWRMPAESINPTPPIKPRTNASAKGKGPLHRFLTANK